MAVVSHLPVTFFVAIVFVCTLACGIVAVAYAKWYSIDHPLVTLLDYGVYWKCQRLGLQSTRDCSRIDTFSNIVSGCSRSGDEMLQKSKALAGTATAAPIVLALAAAGFFAPNQWEMIGRWSGCFLTTIGVALHAFSVGWGAYMYDSWYFCGLSYCDYQRSIGSPITTCSSKPGAAFYFEVAALILSVVLLATQGVLTVRKLRSLHSAAGTAKEPTTDDSRVSNHLSSVFPIPTDPSVRTPAVAVEAAAGVSSPMQRGAVSEVPTNKLRLGSQSPIPELIPELGVVPSGRPPAPDRWPDFSQRTLSPNNVLPDGEWILDAACGLYWSNTEQLYVHLESGLFYDPHSCMWFDSETNEWFEA